MKFILASFALVQLLAHADCQDRLKPKESVASMTERGILPEAYPDGSAEIVEKKLQAFVERWNQRTQGSNDDKTEKQRLIDSTFPVDRSIGEVLFGRFRKIPIGSEDFDDGRFAPYPFDSSARRLVEASRGRVLFYRPADHDTQFKIDLPNAISSWSGKHILDLGAGNFMTALSLLGRQPALHGENANAAEFDREVARLLHAPKITGVTLLDLDHQQRQLFITDTGRDAVQTELASLKQIENLNPITGKFFEELNASELCTKFGKLDGGYDSYGVFTYSENPQQALKLLAEVSKPGAFYLIVAGPRKSVVENDKALEFFDFVKSEGRGFRVFKAPGNSSDIVLVRTEEEFFLPELQLAQSENFKYYWRKKKT